MCPGGLPRVGEALSDLARNALRSSGTTVDAPLLPLQEVLMENAQGESGAPKLFVAFLAALVIVFSGLSTTSCWRWRERDVWTEFLRELRDRGLDGVNLVTPTHARLRAAIRRLFQNAGWQRCRVHAMRNLLGVACVTTSVRSSPR